MTTASPSGSQDPDPAVKQLQYVTITRQGDKLAFVASTQGTQDEIRFYQANGPAPSAPTPMCAITGANGGEFSYTSFAPDGTQIAWQEGDGIHEGSVGSLSDCSSITDQLVIPGGSEPFVGAADVNVANSPSPPASAGNAGGGARAAPVRPEAVASRVAPAGSPAPVAPAATIPGIADISTGACIAIIAGHTTALAPRRYRFVPIVEPDNPYA